MQVLQTRTDDDYGVIRTETGPPEPAPAAPFIGCSHLRTDPQFPCPAANADRWARSIPDRLRWSYEESQPGEWVNEDGFRCDYSHDGGDPDDGSCGESVVILTVFESETGEPWEWGSQALCPNGYLALRDGFLYYPMQMTVDDREVIVRTIFA